MTNEVSWDEAVSTSGFVTLVADTEKVITVTNHRLEKKASDAPVAAGEIEFLADVLVEDGNEVKEKSFATTSKRLKKKLRVIFENKKPSDKTKLSILRVGEQFNTQYSVKELKE